MNGTLDAYVFSSVPIGFKRGYNEDAIITYFLAHKGIKNAQTSVKICNDLDIDTRNNCLAIRFIIAKLVTESRLPILSCAKGFFYAETVEEIDNNIEQEVKRMNGISRRIVALQSIKYTFGGE